MNESQVKVRRSLARGPLFLGRFAPLLFLGRFAPLLGAALFLGVALLGSACSSAVPRPANVLDPADDAERTSSVVFADRDLQGLIAVGTPSAERMPETNLLRVNVPIRNLSDRSTKLMVQVEFFDSNRVPYDDVTPRQVLIVPPGGTTNHATMSQKARAQEFIVRLWPYRKE